MSIEKLKAACETHETYANVVGDHLAAVCEPLAAGLPLAAQLLGIAKGAGEKVVSIPVAFGKQLLGAAGGGAKKS